MWVKIFINCVFPSSPIHTYMRTYTKCYSNHSHESLTSKHYLTTVCHNSPPPATAFFLSQLSCDWLPLAWTVEMGCVHICPHWHHIEARVEMNCLKLIIRITIWALCHMTGNKKPNWSPLMKINGPSNKKSIFDLTLTHCLCRWQIRWLFLSLEMPLLDEVSPVHNRPDAIKSTG